VARVILITGGGRSGKSAYALRLGQSLSAPRTFVATCLARDDEMQDRIRRHQAARAGMGWETIEEPLDLPRAIRAARKQPTVLVDCLTLWVSNLMLREDQTDEDLGEQEIEVHALQVLAACQEHPGTVLFVTNEVGWGIIPENAMARRFRDLAGRCNQAIAAGADDVIMVVCGLPVYLKKGTKHGPIA
jgi:adenosylcobinamide kinase/adenosylcobinamide-phosphate guanylyltransferase